MHKSRIAVLAAVLLAGTAPIFAQPAADPAAASGHEAALWQLGRRPRRARPSVKPGDDFWRYANNSWFQRQSDPGRPHQLGRLAPCSSEDVERQLRAIVESAGGTDPAGRQVGDFYASWMDEAGIEARGIAAAAALSRPDRRGRATATTCSACSRRRAIRRRSASASCPIRPIRPAMSPPPARRGLGMPNRDYYLREGEQYDRYRAAYRDYIVTLQRLAGIADAGGQGRRDHRARAPDRRGALDAGAQPRRHARSINPMNRDQLDALAPQFDWPTAAPAARPRRRADHHRRRDDRDHRRSARCSTGAARDLEGLDDLPLPQRQCARILPRAFDEANFDFYSRTLRGVEQQRDRWKRGLGLLNGTLGEAVGRIYVERHFPAESRRQMTELIGNLRAALRASGCAARLDGRGDPRRRRSPSSTRSIRASAIRSASSIIRRSGSTAPTCSAMSSRAGEFDWNLQLSRLPNPVDRALWEMTPQTINAYYNPLPTRSPSRPRSCSRPSSTRRRSGGQLRRDRRGDRPRDRPRLRRSGPPLRRHRAAAATGGRRDVGARFTERTARLGEQYDGYRAAARATTSTASSPWARISAISAGSKWPMPPIGATSPSTASRR